MAEDQLSKMTDVTSLLARIREGHPDAEQQLIDVVYKDLKKVAHRQMSHERPDHTMVTTDLVHEFVVKALSSSLLQSVSNRRHFLNASAQAMRRILVDYANAQNAQKRGGGHKPIPLESVHHLVEERDIDVRLLNEALEGLQRDRRRAFELLCQTFFIGTSTRDLEAQYKVSVRTIQSDVAYAKAYVRKKLED